MLKILHTNDDNLTCAIFHVPGRSLHDPPETRMMPVMVVTESLASVTLERWLALFARMAIFTGVGACDCGLAWLNRDNPQLLSYMYYAECYLQSSGWTAVKDLDPVFFTNCPGNDPRPRLPIRFHSKQLVNQSSCHFQQHGSRRCNVSSTKGKKRRRQPRVIQSTLPSWPLETRSWCQSDDTISVPIFERVVTHTILVGVSHLFRIRRQAFTQKQETEQSMTAKGLPSSGDPVCGSRVRKIQVGNGCFSINDLFNRLLWTTPR